MAVKQMSPAPSAAATEVLSDRITERRRTLARLNQLDEREPGLIEEARQAIADAKQKLLETEHGRAVAALEAAEAKLREVLHTAENQKTKLRDKLWDGMTAAERAYLTKFRNELEAERMAVCERAAGTNHLLYPENYQTCIRKNERILAAQKKLTDDIVRVQPDVEGYIRSVRAEFHKAEGEDI